MAQSVTKSAIGLLRLTHWVLNKMAAIAFSVISLNENVCILPQILLEFVHWDPISNESTLLQAIAWHRFSTKTLPYLLLIYDACIINWSPTNKLYPLTSSTCCVEMLYQGARS